MAKGDEIIVTWEHPTKSTWGAKAGSGHKWHQEDLPLAPSDLPNLTEAALGFSAGTMQVLERAFSLGLTRLQSWDTANLSPEWQDPARDAANIFKRGVPVFPRYRSAKEPSSPGKSAPDQGSYAIQILDSWQQMLPPGQGFARALLIADLALASRIENFASDTHFVHWVESDKNLETVAALTQVLKKHQRQNQAEARPVFAIGGGLLLDLVGFAAGLLGLQVIYVPTTLLAMLDAGLGGKTAVNHPIYGKNQLGLFWNPQQVILDTSFLSCLPARQWYAGLAEGIKHALLMRDQPMLTALCRLKPDPEEIKPWLLPNIKIKAQIVAKDPWEQGERAVLNLGHTIAHALENFSEHKLLHGEAVLIGLIVDVYFSHQQGGLDQRQLQSILDDLRLVIGESLGPMALRDQEFLLDLIAQFSDSGRWQPTFKPWFDQDKKKRLAADSSVPMIQLDWTAKLATNRLTHALATSVPIGLLEVPFKESAMFLNSILFQPI